jgi:hypothetical protein
MMRHHEDTIMRWIDGEDLSVGDIGFLVSAQRQGSAPRYGLYQRPCHTNISHAPKLTGWCGSTNDVSRFACGLARVVRSAGNGRVQVVEVDDAEGAAWLRDVAGYPELIPDEWVEMPEQSV